jgi:hypothetical protein
MRSVTARRADRGATMTGLLTALIAVGILFAAGYAGVRGLSGYETRIACQTEIRNVRVASDAYYSTEDVPPRYADSIDALVAGGYLDRAPHSARYTISYASGGDAAPSISGTLAHGGAC